VHAYRSGKKFVISTSAAVHGSVGMLFIPRQKFGGLLEAQALFYAHSLMQKSKGLLEEGR
jgi:hypothetical protein